MMASFMQNVSNVFVNRVGGGFFGARATPIVRGPQFVPVTSHPIFGGVQRFFIGNHQNAKTPLPPARHPLKISRGAQ
jgi:hypothetical protein